MRLLLPVMRNRQRRRAAGRRSSLLLPGMIGSFLFSFLLVSLVGITAYFYFFVTQDLPSIARLPGLIEPPDGMIFHPTQIYDRSGKTVLLKLDNPAATGFRYLSLDPHQADHFPVELVNCMVSTLDPQFWAHPGYSLSLGGKKTLTEDLMLRFLLWHEAPGWRRELRGKILAAQATSRYGRERIMEWVLNSANYGRLAFGADAAARVYFGKPASQINLAEAALLAATVQAPALNPQDNLRAAQERAKIVLNELVSQGMITQEEARRAAEQKPEIRPASPSVENEAPFFTQAAVKQLVDQFGWERLERGGLEVITTLDEEAQKQLTCTSQWYIQNLEGTPPAIPEGCSPVRHIPSLPAVSSGSGGTFAGEAVILDARSGQVMAVFSEHPPTWETAMTTGRPAGSLLSPFVYLAGFTRGFSPASLVWDLPPEEETELSPEEAKTFDGPMRARNALVNEEIGVTENVFQQVGAEIVWNTARQMGIYLPDEKSPPDTGKLLRDGGEVNLLDLMQAYATLANQGIQTGQVIPNPNINKNPEALLNLSPTYLLTVTDQEGKVWLDWTEPKTRPVLPSALAYLVTDILSDETARWKTLGHPNALEMGKPAAVKSGKTESGQDVWTIGYLPDWTVGVWLGTQGNGLRPTLPDLAAAPLWNALMTYADERRPAQAWEIPPGISQVEVCDPSGLLPTQSCANIVREVFLNGTEPTQADNLYFSRQINRETGNLATVFTDLDFLEEKSYLRVPEGREAWAEQVNIALPPQSYDVLYHPLVDGQNQAALTSPGELAVVHGRVEIHGSAGGEDFSFYRIQIGQGLNPVRWLLNGEDHKTIVRDGLLETWDTQGLNGLFVLQLLVVEKDGNTTISTRQVTVDNRAPEIRILYPAGGATFTQGKNNRLSLQAEAVDEIGLKDVVFLMDDRELGRLNSGPYTLFWSMQPGVHKLTVTGSDLAGNTRSAVVQFNVK